MNFKYHYKKITPETIITFPQPPKENYCCEEMHKALTITKDCYHGIDASDKPKPHLERIKWLKRTGKTDPETKLPILSKTKSPKYIEVGTSGPYPLVETLTECPFCGEEIEYIEEE